MIQKQKKSDYPPANKLQSKIYAWLLFWPIVAVFADGWHHHHLDAGGESLFNPFHDFLYLGVVCVTFFIIFIAYKHYKAGYLLKKSLPEIYLPAVWGIVIFIVAAACDLTWHHIFGFEESVDALLSPPHLFLAFGGLLAVSCIIRLIWEPQQRKITGDFVAALGFSYFFLIFIFFIQYCHPYYERWLSGGIPVLGGVSYIQAAALAGGLVRTFVFCTMLFSTIRFFKFPKGSLFLLLFAESVGIGFMGGQYQYIISGIVCGLLTEILYHTLYNLLAQRKYLRIFGFLIPLAFFVPYTFITIAYDPTWWSVHMVAGLIVVNGIVGLLLTYMLIPPGHPGMA